MGEERSLRRGRRVARTLVTWVATCLATCAMSLVLVPTGPGAADTGCTVAQASDTCSATAFDLDTTSVTFTLTATNYYPACQGGQRDNCMYQYFVRALSSGYNDPAAGPNARQPDGVTTSAPAGLRAAP